MFRSAKALDRAKTHSTFRQAMADYHKTSESWFDGGVDSVDRRLARVDKLLHHVRTVIARLSFADSVSQLRAAQTLSADRAALVDLKRTLLTGAADYSTWGKTAGEGLPAKMDKLPKGSPDKNEWPEDHWLQDDVKKPSFNEWSKSRNAALDTLPSADRRWVTLEAARFVSAHTDCLSDPEELATRARHHAQLKTSTSTSHHSSVVTAAFVGAVIDLGKRSYRPPAVKTAAVRDDSPPEAMFL